ncbi:hypothetical protein [Fibrobacter succinogenes]|uniref:hypothetical protein n=1 Tax=Fibrobacter succinogenes TaxID=833 RepID=UPI001567FD4B|nr:hypothetical protein [Fibrobacter succinogenes]
MKHRNINLALFSAVLAFLIVIPFVSKNLFATNQNAPWQLSPFNSGDSLSTTYKERYRVLDQQALIHRIKDKTPTIISVMIDGWGVPYDEDMLAEDFSFFSNKTALFALHKRFLGHTAHAEAVELRTGFKDGLRVGSGDSTDCANLEAHPAYEMNQAYCCLRCSDNEVAAKLDSILSDTTWKRIAWTARETNLGDRDKLHNLLHQLAEMADRHPEVQFIIQGAHRPILGTPETRRKYLAPWVPAVFLNAKIYIPDKK